MKLKQILLSVIILPLCIAGYSQDKTTLSYDDFLTIIEEKLPELERNENNLKMTENILFKAKALHDVTFKATASGFGTKYYWDSEEDRGKDYTAGFSITGDISTKLPSGTIISAGGGYNQSYTKQVEPRTGFIQTPPFITSYSSDSSYIAFNPSLKLSISQPLLYNFFGYVDRHTKTDAKQKVAIEKLNKAERDKLIMSYYKTVYFLLIQYDKIKVNLKRSINNTKKLEEQTRAKMKTGLAENDDLQRVIGAVYRYQESYQAIEEEYLKLLNELSYFIDVEKVRFDTVEFDRIVTNSSSAALEEVTYEETREAQITSLNRENLVAQKKVQQNKTLPHLDLFGSLDVNFNHPVNESETYKDGKYESNTDKPSYKTVAFTAGLNFTYSFGNHLLRGALIDTELAINNLDTSYQIQEKDFNKKIKDIIISVDIIKNRIAIKEKIIISLKSQYQTELKKYNQARIELRSLLDTDSSVFNEQTELIRLKLQLILLNNEYNKLVF